MAPSRQERRKAERDAAKRTPAKTGAARGTGAAGAAAALANLNVKPRGDWSTQTVDPLVGPGGYSIALLADESHVIGCHLRDQGSQCGE